MQVAHFKIISQFTFNKSGVQSQSISPFREIGILPSRDRLMKCWSKWPKRSRCCLQKICYLPDSNVGNQWTVFKQNRYCAASTHFVRPPAHLSRLERKLRWHMFTREEALSLQFTPGERERETSLLHTYSRECYHSRKDSALHFSKSYDANACGQTLKWKGTRAEFLCLLTSVTIFNCGATSSLHNGCWFHPCGTMRFGERIASFAAKW